MTIMLEELAPRVAVLEARYESIADDLWAIRQGLHELSAALRDQAAAAADIGVRLAEHEAKLDVIMERCDRGRSALLPRGRRFSAQPPAPSPRSVQPGDDRP